MTSSKHGQTTTQGQPNDFAWDALPEVARERWEEMVAYTSSVENQLTKAKATRAQAEVERQRIATETLAATKEACQAVVAESKRTITKIKKQAAEAERNFEEAKYQLEESKTIRYEAEAYRDSVKASAEKQAQELLQKSTHAAEIECARLKKQATLEAYQLLVQAEAMRASALEELEAQKIYSEAAVIKADANEALKQLTDRLQDSEFSLGLEGSAEGSSSPESAATWEMVAQMTSGPENDGGSPESQEEADAAAAGETASAPARSRPRPRRAKAA